MFGREEVHARHLQIRLVSQDVTFLSIVYTPGYLFEISGLFFRDPSW